MMTRAWDARRQRRPLTSRRSIIISCFFPSHTSVTRNLYIRVYVHIARGSPCVMPSRSMVMYLSMVAHLPIREQRNESPPSHSTHRHPIRCVNNNQIPETHFVERAAFITANRRARVRVASHISHTSYTYINHRKRCVPSV